MQPENTGTSVGIEAAGSVQTFHPNSQLLSGLQSYLDRDSVTGGILVTWGTGCSFSATCTTDRQIGYIQSPAVSRICSFPRNPFELRSLMSEVLSPQLTWSGAQSWLGLVHLLAAVIAVGLVVWLFWAERQIVSPPIGRWLLALRLLAIGVVLVVLWQPTWAWVVDESRRGRIAVAIDVSDSMRTIDLQATPAEQRDWLAAIGWLHRNDPADGATLTDQGGTQDPSLPPEGLDAESWRDLQLRLSRWTRWELARDTLLAGPDSLLEQLQRLGDVELLLFAGQAVSSTVDELQKDDPVTPAAALPALTQLNVPLHAAQQNEASTPLLGIVLFTDGRETSATNVLDLAKVARQNNVPIFTVMMGSTHRPKDLSLVAVDAPLAVYRDDHPLVKVLVATAGFAGESVDVTLTMLDGQGEFTPVTKSLVAADTVQTLEFALPADELGERRYAISIEPRPGETSTENNRKEFSLQVVDDRSRVLLVDGSPRWEFRYLEIAYARDERVRSEVVLFDQPSLGILPEPYFPRNWPLPELPSDRSALADKDLVILGDVLPSDLPESRWQELEKYVSEQGGLLVLQAGREAMPLQHNSPTLRTLLPVTNLREQLAPIRPGSEVTSRGWSWSLSAEGASQTLLQFANDPEANRAIWNILPGATWVVAGEPKPAATVWAWGRNEAAGAPVPLIVIQNYGLGQVLWIATDGTWRWRFRSADQFHHRFWGQLARYASATKLAAGNEFVQFGPLKRSYAIGEPIEVQARWSAKFLGQPAEQRQATVEVFAGTNKIEELALTSDPQRPLLSLGVLSSLPPGDYRLKLLAPQANLGTEALEAPVTVAQTPTIELADLMPNEPLLQEIAETSGGQFYRPGEADQIPQQLPIFQVITSIPQQQPLWDRWPTYCLLGLLLTAEWVIRRRNGLP